MLHKFYGVTRISNEPAISIIFKDTFGFPTEIKVSEDDFGLMSGTFRATIDHIAAQEDSPLRLDVRPKDG